MKGAVSGGAATTLSLATVGTTSINAALPPRIEFADGQPRVLVYDVEFSDPAEENHRPPRLRLINVNEAVTSAQLVDFDTPSSVDLDDAGYSSDHALAGEYDFACRQDGTLARCTIAAIFYQDDSNNRFTRPRSIRFTIDGAQTTPPLVDSDWAMDGTQNVNGVIGLAIGDGGGDDLLASFSRPILDGTSVLNSLVVRYPSDTVSNTPTAESAHRGDAETCSTTSGNGENFGAAGMLGGYSISYCGACSRTGGLSTIESVSWGDRFDGNSNCY